MTATFNWSVTGMSCLPQAEGQVDVVVDVTWQCAGQENGFASSVYGVQKVTYTPESSFTPYADLTQEQVLGWVWAAEPELQATMQKAVQERLDVQINPPVVTPPLPWAPAPMGA